MKNKRLLMVLAFLASLMIFGLVKEMTAKPKQLASSQVAKVGVLQFVSHEALDTIYRGIEAGLAESGYDGDRLEVTFLNAEGDQSKVQTMSQTLVNGTPQVLIGIATPAVQGLANSTKDIPVVMGAVTDPVGANLVTNVLAPEGNVTGVSDRTPIAEQIELMKMLTPDAKAIGVLSSSSEDNAKTQVEAFKALATKAGFEVLDYTVPSTNEITTTMNIMLDKVDAVWLPLDNTVASAFATVVQAAKEAKKPIYPSVDTMVAEGGLASVVIDQFELGRATGKMAAQLLDGKSVEQLPVMIFDKGQPVINQQVADELGITLSNDILEKASFVPE